MPRLSIVTITQNNQDLIKDCLDSASWADEIIIVDALSTDNTVDICKKYTEKIFSNPLTGTLSQQWNFAFSKANGDWIFSLAVDERISAKLKESILKAVNSDTRVYGFYVPMRNFFLGRWIRHCGWYPNYNVRLFRKATAVLEEREHGVLKVSGKTEFFPLESFLEHFTSRSVFQHLQKENRYSDFESRELFQKDAKFRRRYIVTKPLKDFKKVYISQGGFKEGMHGFLLACFSAFYKILLYVKYWELVREKGKRGL